MKHACGRVRDQDGGNDGYDLVSRLPSDFDDYGDSSRGANGLLLAGAGSVSENGSQVFALISTRVRACVRTCEPARVHTCIPAVVYSMCVFKYKKEGRGRRGKSSALDEKDMVGYVCLRVCLCVRLRRSWTLGSGRTGQRLIRTNPSCRMTAIMTGA